MSSWLKPERAADDEKPALSWSALALAALLFLFLNLFAGNFFLDTRLDLTQSRQSP